MTSENAPDDPTRPARRPWVRAGLFVAAAGGVLAALALLDVIPGGWRLRTLIVPQSVQDQRRRAEHRADRLASFAEEPVPQPGGTLFIGSSTIERFPTGDLLSGWAPVNRGIGDEDLNGLEARALETAVRLQPKVVVLYAGSVDTRRAVDDGTWTSPPAIVSRAGALASELLGLTCVEKVAVLGILPERETGPELRARLDAVNAGLAEVGEAPGIVFLPTGIPQLVDASGNLRPGVSADALHLNEAGYRTLAPLLADALRSEESPGPGSRGRE